MKIIEALKKIKYLTTKAADYRQKIGLYSADMDFDQPPFPDMKSKVSELLQGHADIVKEICNLKHKVQKTNCLHNLTIELNNTQVTKTLYEWIQRRRELSALELSAWNQLTDKGLSDKQYQQTTGAVGTVKMRRYYDPAEKAKKVDQLKYEPVAIDAALEMANCTVDLLES